MNHEEQIIILAMAKRLEEVVSLSGFLFPDTEQLVLDAVSVNGLNVDNLSDFKQMAKGLRSLADRPLPRKPLPQTDELKQKILKEYRLKLDS